MEHEVLSKRPFRLVDAILIGACGIGAGFLLDLDHAVQCRLTLGRAPVLWEIHTCGSRFLHLPVLYLALLVSGTLGAYLVGYVTSLALRRERYANAMLFMTLGISVFVGLFVVAWLVMGLSGWLVWAVTGFWAMAVAHSVGWVRGVLNA